MADRSEAARLRALEAYGVLDTLPTPAFDRLTALAAEFMGAPIALVSLIDADRQWSKSSHGLEARTIPRSMAFCSHAIAQEPGSVLVIEDARQDPRFRDSDLVTGQPGICFYAGAVLSTEDGHNLGTLCVMDQRPGIRPTEDALSRLRILARVVVDELELSRATRQAAGSRRMLDMAEQMAGLGRWGYERSSGKVTWSQQVFSIHGLSVEEEQPGYGQILNLYHPEDRVELDALVRRAIATGQGYELEARILRPDGELRWIAARAECVLDEKGMVSGLCGVFQDITRQKEAAASLAASERRFRSLTDNAPDIVAECSLQGTLTYLSPACLGITGFRPDELVGRSFADLMHPEDAGKVLAMCRRVFESRGRTPTTPVAFRANHKSGRQLWLECRPTLVSDPETGMFVGLADVIRDISHQKALEAQLTEALQVAEAAAAAKGEFLANMSHELRTPLTSILGFSHLAAEQPDLGETTGICIDRINNAGRALLCTVNDILDFSKLEAGQVSFRIQPTDVNRLALATLELFTPQAGARDLDLVIEADQDDLVLAVDPDRLRQILLNLVGNAVKFTPSGGVTLRTRYSDPAQVLTVEVIDSGAGIAAEKLPRLFQRFSQIDGSLTRTHRGTGLGLAICKGLVEAMGGQIGVTSTVGQGSRFWFSIPAQRSASLTTDVETGVEVVSCKDLRILVVDDHPVNRDLIRLFLGGLGAEVSQADDGQAAVDLARLWPYDAILMDLRMPGLDGKSALRMIRESEGPNQATPILAFTADSEAGLGTELKALGFCDVVAKPVDLPALLESLSRATTWEALPAPPLGVSAA